MKIYRSQPTTSYQSTLKMAKHLLWDLDLLPTMPSRSRDYSNFHVLIDSNLKFFLNPNLQTPSILKVHYSGPKHVCWKRYYKQLIEIEHFVTYSPVC